MSVTSREPQLRALMMASQGGDPAAHRALLEQLSGMFRSYFKKRLDTTGRHQAEDLVQETLLAIHMHRDAYNPAQPFTPWAYAIARYRLIDFLRRSKTSAREVPLEEADTVLADDDTVEAESAFDLERLLARLPDKIRNAIQLVKVEGLSVNETAQKTGMSESAIKVSIHRGLKAMAKLMREAKST